MEVRMAKILFNKTIKAIVFSSIFILSSTYSSNTYASSTRVSGPDDYNAMHDELSKHFDQMFRAFMSQPFQNSYKIVNHFSHPKVDVYETDDNIEVSAELPGIDKDKVDVEVFKDHISLRYENNKERKEEGKNYFMAERNYGSFERIVSIPEGGDIEKAKAQHRDGVLYITIPKLEEAKVKSKKLQIK
jgi:HSP20 family protein